MGDRRVADSEATRRGWTCDGPSTLEDRDEGLLGVGEGERERESEDWMVRRRVRKGGRAVRCCDTGLRFEGLGGIGRVQGGP